jgi:hypothetical protein
MEASSRPQSRVSVGGVVSETFSIYGQNWVILILSSLVVFVVAGLAAGLLSREGGIILQALATIIQLAAYALYTGFVVKLVQDVRDGKRDQTAGDLLSSAAPAILALIVFGILFGIGVTIGLFLLVIPGLILITFWCVGAPSIVIEGEGPIGAFGRSWNLVRGDAWSVFAALIVILLIVIVIGIILSIIGIAISDGAMVVASTISNVITAPIFAIAVSAMFFDLGGGSGTSASTSAPAPTEPPPPPPAAPAA